jgi:hypothetical protein
MSLETTGGVVLSAAPLGFNALVASELPPPLTVFARCGPREHFAADPPNATLV